MASLSNFIFFGKIFYIFSWFFVQINNFHVIGVPIHKYLHIIFLQLNLALLSTAAHKYDNNLFTSKLCLRIAYIEILNSPTENRASTRFVQFDAKDEQNRGVTNAAEYDHMWSGKTQIFSLKTRGITKFSNITAHFHEHTGIDKLPNLVFPDWLRCPQKTGVLTHNTSSQGSTVVAVTLIGGPLRKIQGYHRYQNVRKCRPHNNKNICTTRQLGRPRSPANRFPPPPPEKFSLSLSTIWRKHLPFNQ